MRICIVAEGSYPYTMGGVSSWADDLICSFPEHEFVILSVISSRALRGKFAYTLPDAAACYRLHRSARGPQQEPDGSAAGMADGYQVPLPGTGIVQRQKVPDAPVALRDCGGVKGLKTLPAAGQTGSKPMDQHVPGILRSVRIRNSGNLSQNAGIG